VKIKKIHTLLLTLITSISFSIFGITESKKQKIKAVKKKKQSKWLEQRIEEEKLRKQIKQLKRGRIPPNQPAQVKKRKKRKPKKITARQRPLHRVPLEKRRISMNTFEEWRKENASRIWALRKYIRNELKAPQKKRDNVWLDEQIRYAIRQFAGKTSPTIKEVAKRIVQRHQEKKLKKIPEKLTELEKKIAREEKLYKRQIKALIKKLYSDKKNISEQEWNKARRTSEKIPRFKPVFGKPLTPLDIGKILKLERKNAIKYAKQLDKIKRNINKKRRKKWFKNFQKAAREWKDASNIAKHMPGYDENISNMLSRKLSDVIHYADEIDKIEKKIIKEKNPNLELAREAVQLAKKLPEYKPKMIENILRFFSAADKSMETIFRELEQKYGRFQERDIKLQEE